MQSNKPFNPFDVLFENSEAAEILGPIPQLQIPANLPPQLIQSLMQQVLQQVAIVTVPPVNYELFQAALESTRCKSQYRTKGQLTAMRNVDMSIPVSVSPLKQGWS